MSDHDNQLNDDTDNYYFEGELGSDEEFVDNDPYPGNAISATSDSSNILTVTPTSYSNNVPAMTTTPNSSNVSVMNNFNQTLTPAVKSVQLNLGDFNYAA